MKKILLMLGLGFLLVGCTSSEYQRSNERAMIYTVDFDEINQKISNDETFMFMMGRDECSNCEWVLENVLFDYVKDHGFDFYKVQLPNDEEAEEVGKAKAFVKQHPNPEEFLTEDLYETDVLTPSFYFIVDGEVEDIYIGGGLTEEIFDGYIQKYRLDEVK